MTRLLSNRSYGVVAMGLGQNHAPQEFHDSRSLAIVYPAILACPQNFDGKPCTVTDVGTDQNKKEKS